jgi:aspartate kinase
MALADIGVPSASFTGSQAGFITDTNHMAAKIIEVKGDRIRAALDAGRVPVVAGSQGVFHGRRRDVSGPGWLGHHGRRAWPKARRRQLRALHRRLRGLHHRSPRLVPEATKIKRISFDETAGDDCDGLPQAGDALGGIRASRHGVELHVRSAFTWEPGTWVVEEDPDMEHAVVRGITHDLSEAKITVTGVPDRPGVAGTLFRALADRHVNVDMIVQNASEGRRPTSRSRSRTARGNGRPRWSSR